MRKVLILNTVYDKGGAAKVARQLFKFIKNREGYQVYFAHGRGPRESDSNVFKFGNRLEVFFHVFLVRFFGLEGYGSYFSTKKLIKFIEKKKINIVHIHNLHGYYVNFYKLISYLNREKIKVVWTLQDEWGMTWLPAYSFGCEHCKTLKGECESFRSYPKTFNSVIAKKMFSKKRDYFSSKWSPIIVSASKWIDQEVKESYLAYKESIVIYNGVNSELFKEEGSSLEMRKKYNLPLDKKIILFSAVDVRDKRKGVEFLVKVIEKMKNDNVLFLAVGGGEIKSIDNPNIIFKGYVKNEVEMKEMYNTSDLYLFLSLADTMPLAVLEAMACQLPVISFDIPPAKELLGQIKHKKDLLVYNKDVDLMVKKIREVIFDDQLLAEIGALERRIIEDSFSIDKFYNEYLNLYNNLIL